MSLDGFVNDRDGGLGLLYPDLAALRQTDVLQEFIQTTGAVVMGRRAYDLGGPAGYADYEYQVPIFVLTHRIPETLPKPKGNLTFTFVADGIESAIAKANAAAGQRYVTVIGGASTAQQCLRAGLVDEIHIGLRPVLLGAGLRLFEHPEARAIELQRMQVTESATGTELRFRVVK